MKTKTIKTPLMMAEAYSLSVCPSSLALESKLSRNLESHTVLVPRLSHYEWKNLKNNLFRMNVLYIENVFIVFPLMMFLVAKQRVMMSGLVRELAHRHRAMTSARKLKELKHQQRGFHGFCLLSKVK